MIWLSSNFSSYFVDGSVKYRPTDEHRLRDALAKQGQLFVTNSKKAQNSTSGVLSIEIEIEKKNQKCLEVKLFPSTFIYRHI